MASITYITERMNHIEQLTGEGLELPGMDAEWEALKQQAEAMGYEWDWDGRTGLTFFIG